MVGIVLVSHSRMLAEGAAELACQMGGEEVKIVAAGGMADGTIGTDAGRVAAAIEAAWSEDGVLVLMDLGSAVLSAEMALDFIAPERRDRVLLAPAPIAEGAVSAAVAARAGSALSEVAAEAAEGLAGKLAHLAHDEPSDRSSTAPAPGSNETSADGEVRARFVVDLAHGLHARPAALLVRAARGAEVRIRNLTTDSQPVSARSLNDIMVLGVLEGHELEIIADGSNASETVDAILSLARSGFGERVADTGTAPTSSTASPGPGAAPIGSLIGLSASPGVVVGPARRFHVRDIEVPDVPAASPAREASALAAALDATKTDLEMQRSAVTIRSGGAAAAIFDAHLLLLEDTSILGPVRDAIVAGQPAARAWHEAIASAVRTWEMLEDPYLRARAADLRSVGTQVLAHMLGAPRPTPQLDAPGILVTEDLSPADAAALDPSIVLGVATGAGGPTSHAALLTRALGIPAVVGIGEALSSIADGTELALDGTEGFVVPEPPAELRAAFAERAVRDRQVRERALAAASAPGRTSDGIDVEVAANIGGPEEVAAAVTAGCDGVGLFRTEMLFLGRADLPTEDEQEQAYRAAAMALGGRPLVIRTLDVGADKPLRALHQDPEANPFLGLRGIRLGLERPELLQTQLRAIARVAADHRLRVMFPMISTTEEFLAARTAYETARDAVNGGVAEIGVMIEVPAAALAAERLADHADFFSIGTNDLTQYVFAAERGNDRVARIADPYHPALLGLIARTARAGSAAGRWTGVCGEFASDPMATALLVGLGVRELSMGAPAIPLVKQALRSTSSVAAEGLAEQALALGSAGEVRALLSRTSER